MKDTITTQYLKWIEKSRGGKRIPQYFNPYNCSEIKDFSQTITATCGTSTSSAALFIFRIRDDK